MKYILIDKWYGRLGNNLIQISKAIYIAKKNNCDFVKLPHDEKYGIFPKIIKITQNYNEDEITDENKPFLSDFFYYYIDENIDKIDFEFELYNILHKYLKQYLIKDVEKLDLVIHIRADDVGNDRKNIHNNYIPPPFYYYDSFIHNHENKYIISDNNNHPAHDYLNQKGTEWLRGDAITDLNRLANCKYLAINPGSFSQYGFYLNNNIKILYTPDYLCNKLILKIAELKGCKVEIIKLPNYIRNIKSLKYFEILHKYNYENYSNIS